MDYTPALAGTFTASGIFVLSRWKGRQLSWTDLGSSVAVGAWAAFVAPSVAKTLAGSGALSESATSSAVAGAVVWALADAEPATQFLPIQFGSYLAARTAAQYIHAYNVAKAEAVKEEALKDMPQMPPLQPLNSLADIVVPDFEKVALAQVEAAKAFKSPF